LDRPFTFLVVGADSFSADLVPELVEGVAGVFSRDDGIDDHQYVEVVHLS